MITQCRKQTIPVHGQIHTHVIKLCTITIITNQEKKNKYKQTSVSEMRLNSLGVQFVLVTNCFVHCANRSGRGKHHLDTHTIFTCKK